MKLFLFFIAAATLHAAEPKISQWVHPGSDGKLVYKTTPKGDRIMDFSYAGYMGGGVAIPSVPVKATVKPSNAAGADDTAAIQKAIDEVSTLKLENGFRGAILLEAGTYSCSNILTISASGIVLRGVGTNSTIKMTGAPHNAITVRTDGAARGNRRANSDGIKTTLADSYVPSGATKFTVADAKGFAVGDTIEIRRPVTESWIKFMGMDDMTRDGKPQTWIRAGNNTVHERQIIAISGNTLTVDVPLSDSFDAQFLNPPGVSVVKITPERLTQIGIENLHIESPSQAISHTESHFSAIRLNAQDAWIRDVLADETMNSIVVNGRRITLQHVAVNRRARHQGSSKPAEFAPNATQVLMDHCTSNADNVWYAAIGAGISGPIVLLNCDFHGDGHVEAHQRWSTGILYDNCHVPNGGIELRNRGSMGSGHGWGAAWGVAWNCEAKEYVIQNPPGAMNWMIGCLGENLLKPRPFGNGPNLPEGVKDSPNTHVTPQSLYLTQLEQRLGRAALQNIGY